MVGDKKKTRQDNNLVELEAYLKPQARPKVNKQLFFKSYFITFIPTSDTYGAIAFPGFFSAGHSAILAA